MKNLFSSLSVVISGGLELAVASVCCGGVFYLFSVFSMCVFLMSMTSFDIILLQSLGVVDVYDINIFALSKKMLMFWIHSSCVHALLHLYQLRQPT